MKEKIKSKQLRRFIMLGICILGLAFISCETENVDTGETIPIENQELNFTTKYLEGNKVEVTKLDNGFYSIGGGDIHVAESQLTDTQDILLTDQTTQAGSKAGVSRWTNNTVVYQMSSNMSSNVRRSFEEAMNIYNRDTNVKFKQRSNEGNYVYLSEDNALGEGGVASFGMVSNAYAKLGPRADTFLAVHELGHVLGLLHEFTRSDRDNHVRINWNNIYYSAQRQFYKDTRSNNLNTSFDINSVMMYESYVSSSNGQPTIVKRNGGIIPRPSARLTATDIKGINNLYPGSGGDVSNGKCDGVQKWRSGVNYRVGDKVLYYGTLYQLGSNGRWTNLGRC